MICNWLDLLLAYITLIIISANGQVDVKHNLVAPIHVFEVTTDIYNYTFIARSVHKHTNMVKCITHNECIMSIYESQSFTIVLMNAPVHKLRKEYHELRIESQSTTEFKN